MTLSKASQIFLKIVEQVEALLTEYQRIPDPLSGPATSSLLLAKGFAVAMGPGAPRQPNQINCEFSLTRSVQVQLTRLIESTPNSPSGYEDAIIDLFDDQFLLLKHFQESGHLDNLVTMTNYVSDNGVVAIPTQDQAGRFLDLTTTFDVVYSENINS